LSDPPTQPGGLPAGGSDGAADLDLLRRYEPVVRYTRGELFFPTAVGPYVAQCSAWARAHTGASILLTPARELTLERLCEESVVHQDRQLYLRFVERPLGRAEYRRWRRSKRDRLRATSRLTTTGVLGRLVDAGLRASLLLRGKVPSGLAAAAEITYREHLDANRFTYYGRVVREGGYVCLQYWYFYAMNDWRSTFHGVNDHEADWEMVTVYLADREDGLRPAWVAFSSHDYLGDDLRRRWDDPELRREGDHPVVFAGAGSHSGAFIPGDYVVSVNPPQLRAVLAFLRRARRLVRPQPSTPSGDGFGIPFVDYARGDGVAIGAGHDAEWSPVLIDDATMWVWGYRGLWGLDTRDRFGGERAPAGPRYERDGSVRSSWANPLGWAGLLTVAPRETDVADLLAQRVAALDRELCELDAQIEVQRGSLRGLRAEARSLANYDHTRSRADARRAAQAEGELALNQAIARRADLADERQAHRATLSGPIAPESPQAHLSKPHLPHRPDQERRTRFLELWAVLSIPLLLSSIAVALTASRLALVTTILSFVAIFTGVEAIARRRFVSLLFGLLRLVAVVALVVVLAFLFLDHWRIAVSVLIAVAALVLLLGNLIRG
jgi:hypothetical protein